MSDFELYKEIVDILYHSSEKYQKQFNDVFPKVLDACLDDYLKLIPSSYVDDLFFFVKIANNRHYMSRIVKSYFQGKHSTAFIQLKNILKSNDDLYVTEIGQGELFYRMRTYDKRKGLSRKDIFHIPISKKRTIKTQRYSAPGYPCLYLGKSIYGCWEEMNRPDTESTLVSCFKSQDKFRVLDLRIPTFNEFIIDKKKYLQLFPLIISCGIPVRNTEDVFKPEYIIPQLLLEWVIDKNSTKGQQIIGVYYTSANKNEDFYILDHEWDNLVLPVQDAMNSDEFCPLLKHLFYCTKPTCYEYELIQGNINTTGYWDNGPSSINMDDNNGDYYWSLFSRMEELIKGHIFDVVDTKDNL